MALYPSIVGILKSRTEEQARIHHAVQLCTEITVLTTQPRSSPCLLPEENLLRDASIVDKEEMDLLEKALEKALQVRHGQELGSRHSTAKSSKTQIEQNATFKDSIKSSRAQTQHKMISKKIDQKEQRNYQSKDHHSPSTKPGDVLKYVPTNPPKDNISSSFINANTTSGKLQGRPNCRLPRGSKKKTIKESQLSDKKSKALTDSSTCNPVSFSKTMEPEQTHLIQQEVLKWTQFKHKEIRLWDKVLALEKKPVSGRDQFMTRMRGMFPRIRPCGSMKRIQALVNRPSQQRQDSPDGQPDDLQTPEHDSKQEWESWDRWRPVWGGLCLTRADDVRDEGRTAPLPMTVTYSTERELTALGTLRMSVALLQQELFLETSLSETLSPQFCSVIRGPLNPSLLRDLYSVLGEGGERFPALVLDSEPDS